MVYLFGQVEPLQWPQCNDPPGHRDRAGHNCDFDFADDFPLCPLPSAGATVCCAAAFVQAYVDQEILRAYVLFRLSDETAASSIAAVDYAQLMQC